MVLGKWLIIVYEHIHDKSYPVCSVVLVDRDIWGPLRGEGQFE